MSRTFAYTRVSRRDLTTENQRLEIEAAGFAIDPRRFVEEVVSGSVPAFQRPGFSKLVDRLEEGDRIVVSRIDRLGRNAMDVRSTVDELARRKIAVHCLALGGSDLTSPAGRMTMAVIAAVAEFEKDLLVERTQAGLRRAVEQGKTLGRRHALPENVRAEIRAERLAGVSLGTLAKRHGVSRSAIQRIERAGS